MIFIDIVPLKRASFNVAVNAQRVQTIRALIMIRTGIPAYLHGRSMLRRQRKEKMQLGMFGRLSLCDSLPLLLCYIKKKKRLLFTIGFF
jgi:hypothetical protein